MKPKVRWSNQVAEYVRSQAPEPRRELWAGIKSLADWDGHEDAPRLVALEDEFSGYWRLRVARHRVIFREAVQEGQRTLLCLAAGPRKTVYEALAELLLDDLAR
jgi:mRNA-degrading endonuclease RelE of RelBE toxin-antitoxin system